MDNLLGKKLFFLREEQKDYYKIKAHSLGEIKKIEAGKVHIEVDARGSYRTIPFIFEVEEIALQETARFLIMRDQVIDGHEFTIYPPTEVGHYWFCGINTESPKDWLELHLARVNKNSNGNCMYWMGGSMSFGGNNMRFFGLWAPAVLPSIPGVGARGAS